MPARDEHGWIENQTKKKPPKTAASAVNAVVMPNQIVINGKAYEGCKLKMVEIYGGKDPDWKGWHNLILIVGPEPGDQKAIAGPIDPQTSEELKVSIRCASAA